MSKEEKRLDILNGAIKIFSKRGLHKAKIEDIAREAGVGKGTIYEYFDSKKDLFQEMIIYSVTQYRNEIIQNFLGDRPIKDKLTSFCLSNGKFMSEHVDMAQTVMSQTEIVSKEMKCWMIECRNELGKTVTAALIKAKNKGELREDLDLEIAANVIFGAINQFYSKRIFFDNERYDDINPTTLVDTLLRGFQ